MVFYIAQLSVNQLLIIAKPHEIYKPLQQPSTEDF